MERQFTSTVYVIDDQKRFLLVNHKKLRKWLPPGGHVEPNELPSDAARREAKEETGLDIQLILQENVWITRWNAKSFPRPYLCLLEEIPARETQPAHQHIDMIYVGRPIGGNLTRNIQENEQVSWFTYQEIQLLKPEVDIFKETLDTIYAIMNDTSILYACSQRSSYVCT
jgi:ADP-ribose pyrophosphatase YjhB (NUDIX family)